jgi:GT2 family glycosyltransferase
VRFPRPTLTIISPWIDHPELIADYEAAVRGADQVIVVDNGSGPEAAAAIRAMVERFGGVYLRNATNRGFSAANNQGLAAAAGDIVVCLNNDVRASNGWLERVQADVRDGALFGCKKAIRRVDGQAIPYLEGWCVAARREIWRTLNGWDEAHYPGIYWEDNDLSLRALMAGYDLVECDWPVEHLVNRTTAALPGAFEFVAHNQAMFEARARKWLEEGVTQLASN